MFRLGNFDIVNIIIRAVAVLLAISIHEIAHGFSAYLLGDKTAKAMGRLSLNPLRHLDPFGALCLLLFGFGWAKPVVINPYYFKKPKRDIILTSLAGPMSNFVMAYLTLLVYKLLGATGVLYANGTAFYYLMQFISTFVWLNIGLCVFNLLPVPPLDGSKIFLPLLPRHIYVDIMRYQHLGWMILMVALALNVLDPILSTAGSFIFNILSFLAGGVA